MPGISGIVAGFKAYLFNAAPGATPCKVVPCLRLKMKPS